MSNKTFTSQDEKSRFSIVHDIDKNLFIEAGAGSGKTTMLVSRMVAMVEAGIPIEKICAITFTKNAALEFYERFEAKLIERSNPKFNKEPSRAGDLDAPTNETRLRCLKALENIDLCFMGTIDSFCNMILSEHPSEAMIPSDAKLIDDKQESDIYKQFYIDCRKGKYGKDIADLSARFSMFYWDDEETFALLMKEIMSRRNIEFIVDEDLCIDFFKCFELDRDNIKKALNKFNEDKTKITIPCKDETKDPIEDIYNPANEVLQKGWHYNYLGVDIALNRISEMTYDGSSDELGLRNNSVIRDVDGHICLNVKDEDNKNALYYKLQNYRYQNSLKFLLSVKDILENYMRKQGKLTYFDYLYYLRQMLVKDSQNDGKLIQYINNRHSYYLIDEFQDTNPLQAEIFFYLSAIDPTQKSWKECKPKPGTLFIVGDPKQSIYRFRAADVSSYLNVKKMFNDDNNVVRYLVNNFRSKNEIKTYYNDVFNELLPEELDEQSKYIDIENTNTNENNDEEKELRGLYTYESYSGRLLDDYPDMSDPKQIANIIKNLVNNSNYQIIGEDKELRPITYKDFMVIFPTKKVIGSYISEFESQDIPTRVEGKVLFEECEGLNVVASILETITNKDNAVSLINTLYGPVFGLNENDLTKYKSEGGHISLNTNCDYPNSVVTDALQKLNNTSKLVELLSPSALYERIIDDYELFKYVSSDNLEIIYFVLELIRQLEKDGTIVTSNDAVEYINTLLMGDSDIERCLSLSLDSNAVHMANIHKVKGLEAPIVILAKAGNASSNPNIRVEYNKDSTNGYVISIDNSNSSSNISFPIISTNRLKEIKEKEKDSLKKENDRLIYVSATRAKNVLIVNSPKVYGRTQKIQATANRWKILKEHINDSFFETIKENKDYKLPIHNKVDSNDLYNNKTTTISNEKSYDIVHPSDIQVSNKIEDLPYSLEGLNSDDTYSTLMGTMVHRLMETIIMSKDKINKEYLIDSLLNEYVTNDYSEYINDFKQSLNTIYDTIHNGGFDQKGKAPKDILPIILSADNVYSEVPFTYRLNNEIYNGVIDLVYEKDSKLHIIDWKTNKDDSSLDEHYKPQLEAYIKACEHCLGLEVEDALIYHIKP